MTTNVAQQETPEQTAFSTEFIEAALRDIDRDPAQVVLSRQGDGALVLRVSQVELAEAGDTVMSYRYTRPYVTVEGEGQVALLDFVDRLGKAVRWAKTNNHTGMADVAVFPGFRPIEAKPEVVVFYEGEPVSADVEDENEPFEDKDTDEVTEDASEWPDSDQENTYADSEADTHTEEEVADLGEALREAMQSAFEQATGSSEGCGHTESEHRLRARLYGYQAAVGALSTLAGLVLADLIDELEN